MELNRIDIFSKKVIIGTGWNINRDGKGINADLDLVVLLLKHKKDNGVNKENLIYYNNLSCPNCAVNHSGDDKVGGNGENDCEQIIVDFLKLDESISYIKIYLSIYEGKKRNHYFSKINNLYLRIVDGESRDEIKKYYVPEDSGNNSSIIFGDFIKEDGIWSFKYIGKGSEKDLEDYCNHFGIDEVNFHKNLIEDYSREIIKTKIKKEDDIKIEPILNEKEINFEINELYKLKKISLRETEYNKIINFLKEKYRNIDENKVKNEFMKAIKNKRNKQLDSYIEKCRNYVTSKTELSKNKEEEIIKLASENGFSNEEISYIINEILKRSNIKLETIDMIDGDVLNKSVKETKNEKIDKNVDNKINSNQPTITIPTAKKDSYVTVKPNGNVFEAVSDVIKKVNNINTKPIVNEARKEDKISESINKKNNDNDNDNISPQPVIISPKDKIENHASEKLTLGVFGAVLNGVREAKNGIAKPTVVEVKKEDKVEEKQSENIQNKSNLNIYSIFGATKDVKPKSMTKSKSIDEKSMIIEQKSALENEKERDISEANNEAKRIRNIFSKGDNDK